MSPNFRICISAPSQDRQLNSSQHTLFRIQKRMRWSAATQQHLTAPTVHAGLAAYDFSSNLPSDFESKTLFLPFSQADYSQPR